MGFAQGFSVASTVAMLCWVGLIFAPRRRWALGLLRSGVIAGLAVAYTGLVLVYFARVEGAGFGSLGEVRALMGADGTLLAGWIHYLAFDLFVGVWIAERADALGVSRLLQGPILFTTFMFGPVGYLLYVFLDAALKWAPAGLKLQAEGVK